MTMTMRIVIVTMSKSFYFICNYNGINVKIVRVGQEVHVKTFQPLLSLTTTVVHYSNNNNNNPNLF